MNILAYLRENRLLPTDDEFELTPLTGGFWNDVYRLRGNGRDWVIKHFRSANPDGLYPILPQAEALALQTLRGRQIAPEPVAFLPDGPLLVYEYFAGDVWQEEVVGIGRLLRRLHDLPVPPDSGFRSLPVTSADILQQGDHLLAQAEPDAFVQQLQAARPTPQPRLPPSRLALVHTDAWVGNFIQNGRDIRLIDWQCPGLGDAAEDVWTFLESGYEMLLGRPRLDEQMWAEFWRGYGGTAVRHRLQFMAPYYAYRVAAHCCLRRQQLVHTNPTASANYRKVFDWLIANLGNNLDSNFHPHLNPLPQGRGSQLPSPCQGEG
jgi:aminoglycoside phosphotransferase (APT) family kinase protein